LTVDVASWGGSDDHGGIHTIVVKFDIAQGLFSWFTVLNNGDNRGYGLARDAARNLYVVGDFQQTLEVKNRRYDGTFINTPNFNLLSAGQTDMFIAKFNQTGGLVWTTKIGGTNVDYARDVTVSPNFIFMSGSFAGDVTFGSTALRAVTTGDGVWIRLNPTTGAVLDALSGGGSSPSSDEAESVVFSAIGDAVYSTINYFGPNIRIGAGTQNPLNPVAEDADFTFISFTACTPIASPCILAHSVSSNFICDLNATRCFCKPGYSGDICDIDINECASNPCKHGGTCVDGVASFVCNCLPGYEAFDCSTDNFDECSSSPCLNGATCTQGTDVFNCTCRAGFLGTWCQTNVDDCISSPCLNGGLCVDGANMYTCTCSNGFSGVNCKDTESSVFAIGAVAGGVAAAVAFLILSLVCYFKCCRKEENKMASATPKSADTPASTGVI